MAEKNFGVKKISLIGASGTPTISSPNNLNIDAINVAISTDISIGGEVTSDLKVASGQSVGIGSTQPKSTLDVNGTVNINGTVNVTGVSTFQDDVNIGTGSTVAFFDISAGRVGIVSTQPKSTLDVNGTLNVSGVSTLGVVEIFSSSGIITNATAGVAVTVFGDLVGIASTAINLGAGSTGSVPYQYGPGITSFLAAPSEENRILGYNTTTNKIIWTGISSVGGLTTTEFTVKDGDSTFNESNIKELRFFGDPVNVVSCGVGIASITVTLPSGIVTTGGISTSSVGFAQTAGIATYTSEWNITSNSSSDYRFTGPGFDGTENDPTIYLTRGEQYKFTNKMNAHPFQIRTAIGGSAYDDGILNNGVSNGTLTWNVQMDAPDILYYQCTSHAGMVGTIYILNENATNLKGGSAYDIPYQYSSGITSFLSPGTPNQILETRGSGLPPRWVNAPSSGISAIGIANTEINSLHYIGISSVASGSIQTLGVSSSALVYNPSTKRLGINTDNLTSNLTIDGTFEVVDALSVTSSGSGGNIFEILNSSEDTVVAVTTEGHVGIGTTIPTDPASNLNTSILNVGIVTAYELYGDGSNLTNLPSVAGGIGIQSGNIIVGSGFTTIKFNGSQNTITGTGTTVEVTINGVSQAGAAGTAVDVIGGIASVTNLNATGISTLGNVEINSGIITAKTGIVTYYGDGSNLTNITANVQVNSQQLISTPVFPVLTNEIGTASSIGIATTGSNPLVFIPSTGRLGVGTVDPQAKIHVVGVSTFDGDAMFINDNGIKFGGVGNTSITIQYNSTTNSLDFVVSS